MHGFRGLDRRKVYQWHPQYGRAHAFHDVFLELHRSRRYDPQDGHGGY